MSNATLEPQADGTTVIKREPLDVSTKVIAVAAAQFLFAVALTIVTGEVNAAELSVLFSALTTAIVGWATPDKVDL